MRTRLDDIVSGGRLMLLPWLQAYWSGRDLEQRSGAAARRPRGIVAVVPFYGDYELLPFFLRHHRRLGVDEFVLLDLSAAGRLAARLEKARDCTVWRPKGEVEPERAIYWLNFLRRHYGTGRWCLSLEPSDMLVFARSEVRQLKDLLEFLESEHRDHLFALVIEMYGERPAELLKSKRGEDPLERLPYFDPLGYTTSRGGPQRSILVRGGVQRRELFAGAPRQSPVLNRIPLVKWRPFYAYLAGTRLMMPRRLNTPHSPWHSSPTACLLRFALLENEAVLATASRAEAGIILADGGGRAYPGLAKLRSRRLKQDVSVRFTGSDDLIEWGLLNPGQWF